MTRIKYTFAPGEKFASREEFFRALDGGQTVWDSLANRPQNAAFLLGWPYSVLRGSWEKRFRKAVRFATVLTSKLAEEGPSCA